MAGSQASLLLPMDSLAQRQLAMAADTCREAEVEEQADVKVHTSPGNWNLRSSSSCLTQELLFHSWNSHQPHCDPALGMLPALFASFARQFILLATILTGSLSRRTPPFPPVWHSLGFTNPPVFPAVIDTTFSPSLPLVIIKPTSQCILPPPNIPTP